MIHDRDETQVVSRAGNCIVRGCPEHGAVNRRAFCANVLYCLPHFRVAERLFNPVVKAPA